MCIAADVSEGVKIKKCKNKKGGKSGSGGGWIDPKFQELDLKYCLNY